jgi:Endonuclease-reverse transcriptase
MDANAKNKTWRSPDTNERSSRLELITQQHGMNIANYSLFDDQLAFIPAGTSFVDITIVGDQDLP